MRIRVNNTILKRYKPLLGMLIFPVLGWIYTFVNQPGKHVYSLVTDVDRGIPLVKAFVMPYSIWIFYIYTCFVYFFMRDPDVYWRSLKTYTVCALFCYFVYQVFQTTVPRPAIEETDMFGKLLGYIYDRDRPFNCFPSIHCFSSYLVMKALYTSSFRNKWNQPLIYGMSSVIIMSTFFVKQHVILDALAGILIAETVYRLIAAIEKPVKSRKPVLRRDIEM